MSKRIGKLITISIFVILIVVASACSIKTGGDGEPDSGRIETRPSVTASERTSEEISEEPATKTKSEAESEDSSSYGYFKITVYCPESDNGRWGYQTKTGVTSKHLQTCAVDPDVIPLGSVIEVNGLTLRAVDTGNKVVNNVVDIFYDGTSEEAKSWVADFGTRHEVKVLE